MVTIAEFSVPTASFALAEALPAFPDELRHPDGHIHLSIKGIDVTIHSDGLIELDL